MKKTSYILALLTAASALMLSGCAKEMGVTGDGAALRFSTNSLEIVSTRATGEALTGTAAATDRTMNLYSDGKLSDMTLELEESVNTDGLVAATKAAEITSLTTFTVAGFDGTTRWFPESTASQQVTTGTTYDDYQWKSSKDYKFYGYANLPSSSDVASAAIESDGVTLTYTAVPESAADQKDILLGASYVNVPAEGKANMTFYHPLAEVVFKLGKFVGSEVNITGITLDGVYTSGTVICDGEDEPTYNDGLGYYAFNWEPTTTTGQVSQTNDSGIAVSSGVIGVPFMLIPQEFTSSNPLTITVNAVVDGNAKIFATTLNSGSWLSGKKYTYTIKEKILELEISSLEKLLAFKSEIESPTGKDYSRYTIKFTEKIEINGEFTAIYDQHKRLNGAVIQGYGGSIENGSIVQNDNDTNNTVGLFSTLNSDNVTFKDFAIKNMIATGKGASFIAGTYQGSQITIINCTFENLISYNTSDSVTGLIIGICKGNAAITDCVLRPVSFEINGGYSSLVIGEAYGKISIDIEKITIEGCNFKSNTAGNVFGYYVGHCADFNGMNIVITDCCAQNNTIDGSWPASSSGLYIHTGDGVLNGVETKSHYNAVAWNNSGDATGLSVSISGMNYNWIFFQ